MKIIYKLLIIAFLIPTISFGQTVEDAYRYSYLNKIGTARNAAVGGAMNSLGAEFAAISSNPATLGIYRSSEIILSPELNNTRTDAELLNNTVSQSEANRQSKFSIGSFGLVLGKPKNRSKWVMSNTAFGINRLASFNEDFTYSGTSPGTITDRYIELANGLQPGELDNFEAGPAFTAGAIFDFNVDLNYESDFGYGSGVLVDKTQTVRRSGRLNELLIAKAGNYNEKLHIGVAIGIPFLSYTEEKVYRETDDDGRIEFFDRLRLEEYLNTTGVGINGKIGIIYNIKPKFKFSAAVHSPSFFALTDDFNSKISYSFDVGNGIEQYEDSSPDGNFQYGLRTPWKFNSGLGWIIDRFGFISGEIEFIDYGFANFNLTTNDDSQGTIDYQNELNGDISDQLSSTVNLRIGAEYARAKYRLRAGLQLLGAGKENENPDPVLSLGAGLRGDKAFIDLAFIFSQRAYNYSPYLTTESVASQTIALNQLYSQMVLTTAFKF